MNKAVFLLGLIAGIIFISGCIQQDKIPLSNCLPSGINLSDVVATIFTVDQKWTEVTVDQKLTELKATCRNGKLVDDAGREISFYHHIDCWGNPPPGYLEIEDKQLEEINKLKKQYTLIEMTCSPFIA